MYVCAAVQVAALAQVDFAVEYCRDSLDAARTVQRALASFREAQRGPVLVVTQSPWGSARLQQDIPMLNEFPCVDVPPLTEDSR